MLNLKKENDKIIEIDTSSELNKSEYLIITKIFETLKMIYELIAPPGSGKSTILEKIKNIENENFLFQDNIDFNKL